MPEKELKWNEIRDCYRTWREDNNRNNEEVVELWETILCDYQHKLKDEKWMVLEQVCVAGLDCNRLDVAEDCLVALSKEFPGSLRVRRLKAMRYEALERYDDALQLYDSIIRHDETNSTARKRKISMLKAQGKIVDAIKELMEYLKKFMSDQEAWMELCDLYISEQEYSMAAFCLEELLLHNPHNHLYYQRYAEIKYTQGGLDNLELARSYFAQAANLNSANMRSLYGMFLAATQIASSPKCTAQKKKENSKIAAWAAKEVSERYGGATSAYSKEPATVKALEGMLGTLQISPSN